MKRTHILILVVLVAAIGVIISESVNTSTYSGFKEASLHEGREFRIMGKLSHEKEIKYNVQKDANSFTFTMIDNEGTEMMVKYNDSKPQDFEKLEQLVITGTMKEGHFEAHKMNLKCPSKYNKDQVPEAFKEVNFSDTK
ncbi:MAG: cytochrome c maturation protein CcmE [Lentimicrobiaceae bacterium]